jgi:hypothetical protein
MLEIKVVCICGQKFKFDVEPINGLMPFVVNCPVCGADGTAAANVILAQTLCTPAAPAAASPIRVNQAPPVLPPAVPLPPKISATSAASAAPRTGSRSTGGFNWGFGVGGAFLGAGLGIGLMFVFFELAGFRFPLLGIGIGVLTGYGARLLFKGTHTWLGVISGAVSLVAVVLALYLMYGVFPIMSIISVIVSASVAFRIASG